MTLEENLVHIIINSASDSVLRHFAADCADRALRSVGVTGVTAERCWTAVEVARLYAEGKTTEEIRRKASINAYAAAVDTRGGAAYCSAANTAWSALWDSESSEAAQGAAWSAAETATLTAEATSRATDAASRATDVSSLVAWNREIDAIWNSEMKWQIEHLQSLIASHAAARSSLLRFLLKRCESLSHVFIQNAKIWEERVFE